MKQEDLKVIADQLKKCVVDDEKFEKYEGLEFQLMLRGVRPPDGGVFLIDPYSFEVVRSYLNPDGTYSATFRIKKDLTKLTDPQRTDICLEKMIGTIGTWRESIKNSLCSGLPCPEEREELREALNLLSSAESKLVMIDQEDLERSSIIFNCIETELK